MALSKLQLTLGGLSVGAAAGICILATRHAAVPVARPAGAAAFSASSDAALGTLWAGVIEVMLSQQALGEDIFLVPGDSQPAEA